MSSVELVEKLCGTDKSALLNEFISKLKELDQMAYQDKKSEFEDFVYDMTLQILF